MGQTEPYAHLCLSRNTGCLQKNRLTRTRLKIDQKRWNPTYDRVLAIETNYQVMPMEAESVCYQEMDVLGDRLDLEGRQASKQFISIYKCTRLKWWAYCFSFTGTPHRCITKHELHLGQRKRKSSRLCN